MKYYPGNGDKTDFINFFGFFHFSKFSFSLKKNFLFFHVNVCLLSSCQPFLQFSLFFLFFLYIIYLDYCFIPSPDLISLNIFFFFFPLNSTIIFYITIKLRYDYMKLNMRKTEYLMMARESILGVEARFGSCDHVFGVAIE